MTKDVTEVHEKKSEKKYTPAEFQESERIEREVLTLFRSSFTTLREAYRLILQNDELLDRCSSFLMDVVTEDDEDEDDYVLCDSHSILDAAMGRIGHMAGDLYARRVTPWPDTAEGEDPTDEQMEAYFEEETNNRKHWLHG